MSEHRDNIIRPFRAEGGVFPVVKETKAKPSEGEPPIDLQHEAEIQEEARRMLELKTSDERGQKDTALAAALGITLETFSHKHERARAFFVAAAGAYIRMSLLQYLSADEEIGKPAVSISDRAVLLPALNYDNQLTDKAISLLESHLVVGPMVKALIQEARDLI